MRVRRLRGSYFMKGSWCDTDRERRRKMLERVAHRKTGHVEGCDATEGGRRGAMTSGLEQWVDGWVKGGRRGGGDCFFFFFINDRKVRLTVGHTLILDLQVFVGSRAGVRENIWTCDHDTLGPVVAPGRKKMKNLTRRVRDSTVGIFMVTHSSYLTLLALKNFHSFVAPSLTACIVQKSSVVSLCEHIYQDCLAV